MLLLTENVQKVHLGLQQNSRGPKPGHHTGLGGSGEDAGARGTDADMPLV